MKKNIFYSLAVLAGFALAGCSGDYDDWADPQSFTEGEAASKYGLSFAAGPDANIVMPVRNDDVRLVALTAAQDKIEDFAVNEVKVNGEVIDATVDKGYVTVSAADLNSIVKKQFFSRASVKRDIKVETSVSLVLSSGDAVTSDVVGETQASITPAAVPAIDAKGYYLLGQWQNWDPTAPQWMTDNGDGTYSATVTTTSDGDNWFKFYQGSYFESGNWDSINQGAMGCAENGDGALKGFIVYTGDEEYPNGVQTPVIKGEGTFEVTIDMNNYVYTVKRAEAQYYVVGGIQGWSETDKRFMFYCEGGNVYSYTTQWPGAWDLKIWDAKSFGSWDKAWGTANDGDGSVTGSLINENSKSFQAPTQNEYYTLTVNMNDLTYEWIPVTPSADYTFVSLIGDFNGWGGDVELEQLSTSPHNWYVRHTLDAETGLKFRANHDWTVSWGTSEKGGSVGDVYYLTPGSENINVPAGTYDFYLNDITGRWNIVRVE